jgi:hypothetical protein
MLNQGLQTFEPPENKTSQWFSDSPKAAFFALHIKWKRKKEGTRRQRLAWALIPRRSKSCVQHMLTYVNYV